MPSDNSQIVAIGSFTFTAVASNNTVTRTLTVPGVAVGDWCDCVLPTTYSALNLSWKDTVTAANTITLYATNGSNASITPGTATVKFLITKLT